MSERAASEVLLGADDEAQVRMPFAHECAKYGLAADQPVVEIRRWNGTTEVHQTRDGFSFASGGREPDREARLATVRRIVEDHRGVQLLPSEEQMVVQYRVSRTTLRRALAELRRRPET